MQVLSLTQDACNLASPKHVELLNGGFGPAGRTVLQSAGLTHAQLQGADLKQKVN
eukprot:SAG31_NODE_6756_length_1897_cov_2.526696_3_plen_55_part_00